MKTGMLKCMMGLAMTFTSSAVLAASTSGGGQIGSADQQNGANLSTYRNMNISVVQCKISAATKADLLKSGNDIPEELSILIDFEDGMRMSNVKSMTVRAFVVTTSKDPLNTEKTMSGVLTGSVTSTDNMKKLVFTSDLIKYNHKYITQQVISYDAKKSSAVVVSNNMVDSSSDVDGTYDCKGMTE